MGPALFDLSGSDVSQASFVLCVVDGARKGLFSPEDRSAPLLLLCYLADNVKLGRSTQYESAQSAVEALIHGGYLPSVTDATRNHILESVRCNTITTLDALMDFVESLRHLFANSSDFQPNNICAPTCVTPDSTLGVYLRTFLARWDCMSFESVCALYEDVEKFKTGKRSTGVGANAFSLNHTVKANQNFLYDLGTSDSVVDIYTSPSVFSGEQQPVDREPLFYLLNARKAMACLDFHAAEDSIHKYYDSGSSLQGPSMLANGCPVRGYPSSIAPSTGGISGAKADPALAMDALVGCITEPLFSNARHQLAMLALATAWAHAGYQSLTRSAIEEAMKTAHQRGDHAAVAKALLLLHVLVSNSSASDGAINRDVSAEEVLARCLDRCASLNLRSLSAQATLLMVRHRARLLLQQQQREELEKERAAREARQQSGPVQNLWSLWSVALMGDAHLVARIYAERAVHISLAPTVKDANAAVADYPMTTGEAGAFTGAAALAAVDLWLHLGLPDMAELQARRALRQLGIYGTTPELVSLFCKLALLQVEVASEAVPGKRGQRLLQLACSNSLDLLGRGKEMFPAESPSTQNDAFFAARLYCCTHAAMAEGQWDKAQRLALRLADASDLPLTALTKLPPSASVEQVKAAELVTRVKLEINRQC